MAQKKGIMFALQILISVVSLLVGLTQITKESAPYVQKVIEKQHQVAAQERATRQSQMGLQYQYRGNDGMWRYYSDPTNVYWARVNLQGTIEYAQNPVTIR